MQKHQKDETPSINEHNPTPQKRNASNRCPLEGHPDKNTKKLKWIKLELTKQYKS